MRNFGAGDILEIAPAQGPEKSSDDEALRRKLGGETLLLPFTKATTPIIDVKAGRVVVVPPTEVEGEAP